MVPLVHRLAEIAGTKIYMTEVNGHGMGSYIYAVDFAQQVRHRWFNAKVTQEAEAVA